MKKLLLLSLTCAFLFSCESPLNKKFNETTAKEDMAAIKKELDSAEIMLLAGTMFRLKMQDKNLEGMTYGEMLEKGKTWKDKKLKREALQEMLAKKAAKEEAERMQRLQKAVVVTCFEKSFLEYDYEEFITYKFVIQNKSEKNIRAIKGEISFTNLFDEEISTLSFVYDDPVAAGKKVIWNATTDYNQFMDDDQTLKNKDLEDLKVVWKPKKIIFEDGSVLE